MREGALIYAAPHAAPFGDAALLPGRDDAKAAGRMRCEGQAVNFEALPVAALMHIDAELA